MERQRGGAAVRYHRGGASWPHLLLAGGRHGATVERQRSHHAVTAGPRSVIVGRSLGLPSLREGGGHRGRPKQFDRQYAADRGGMLRCPELRNARLHVFQTQNTHGCESRPPGQQMIEYQTEEWIKPLVCC